MIGQPPLSGPTRFSCGHAHVGEEHLVEVAEVLVGELGERPALDARRLHVDDQRADALVLRRVGIGAHEAEAPVGVVRARRPHLLAVDDELVAVEHGARLQAREVAAGAGLAHAEAPRDLGPQRREQEPLLLLGRAVVDDRRGDDAEALRVRAARDLAPRHLLEVDHLLRSAWRCARRARAANPGTSQPASNSVRCHVARPLAACARSTASARGTRRRRAVAPPATRRARRGTPRPRVRTAGASRRRVVS